MTLGCLRCGDITTHAAIANAAVKPVAQRMRCHLPKHLLAIQCEFDLHIRNGRFKGHGTFEFTPLFIRCVIRQHLPQWPQVQRRRGLLHHFGQARRYIGETAFNIGFP